MKTTKNLLKSIKKTTTIIAVVSMITTMGMPIYAEDTDLEIIQDTPVQTEVTETEVVEEVIEDVIIEEKIIDETIQDIPHIDEATENEEINEPIVDETQVQNSIQNDVASFSINEPISETVSVSFVLDNAADGQYTNGKTYIELNKGSRIYLLDVPTFQSSNLKEHKGWTLNGQPLNYANPYMYLMHNMTITENLVFKPVFGEATKYTIQLGIETLNTGILTGNVTFQYSADIPFNTVFTANEFNQVQAATGYYFKGWKLNGTLYTTYEALSAEASKIQNTNINLTASFARLEFTMEFFIDEDSKDYVSFEDGSQYLRFISEETNASGLSVIGGKIPNLVIKEGYEFDTWVFGKTNILYFNEAEILEYLSLNDFTCNQYFTIKVKKSENTNTPTPTPEATPNPTPVVTPEATPNPTPVVTPTVTTPVNPVIEEEVVVAPVVNQPTNNEINNEEIVNEETPLANKEEVALQTIVDEETPLATNKASWALINLILTILTAIIAIILFIKKNKKDEDEHIEVIYKKKFKIAALILSILSIIIFIITEDMRLPMMLVDKYTVVMLCLAIAQTVVAIFTKKKLDVEIDEVLVQSN